NSEVIKLQQHLSLLKQEYATLQTKYRDLESRYTYIAATNGDATDSDITNSFASRLVNTISNLHDSEVYSDIKIKLLVGRDCLWKRLKKKNYALKMKRSST
ncbi:hypothetical protein D910_07404, partial [Dendroctonus ponderosae]